VGKHYNGNGRDINKRGMTVEVKPAHSPEQASKNLDQAMRTLKRRVVQEGLVRDMRRKEYFESKGQVRRKKLQEAVRRQQKKNRQPET